MRELIGLSVARRALIAYRPPLGPVQVMAAALIANVLRGGTERALNSAPSGRSNRKQGEAMRRRAWGRDGLPARLTIDV